MKSLSLLSTGSVCLALLACSTAADPPPNNMGGAGAGNAGGSAPTGGAAPSGGAAPQAGSTQAAGGDTGGAAATAGGDSGGGSMVAGAGGTPPAGGAGGAPPTAGSGAGGAGGGSAGGGTVGPELVGSWDGALLQYACGSTGSSYDCKQPAAAKCNDGTTAATVSTIPPSNNVPSSWTMGGTPGTVYDVTFRIRGVVEVTSYIGGTRAGAASVLTTPRNLFQVGGTPQQNNGGPSFDYNTYELDVSPPVASAAANVYFLNSVTVAQNPHASGSPTTHLTFDIDYTATIKVQGGGKVTLKVTDSNCTQVQNCGPTTGNSCLAPRTVSLAGATPAAPSFAQPFQSGNYYGQWVFFDVTDVKVAQ